MRTGNLEALRAHLGDVITLKLQANYGGREIHVPSKKKGKTYTSLVQSIGEKGAQLLVENFGGEQFYCPLSDADELRRVHSEMQQRYQQGESTHAIATTTKKPAQTYSTRWVRKIVSANDETQQLGLFK